jgi:hypothetical protein
MLVFREEAENCTGFDRNVLRLYREMVDETVIQIENLENIQEPNKANIEDRYLPK